MKINTSKKTLKEYSRRPAANPQDRVPTTTGSDRTTGMTLVEMLMAVGVGSLVLMVVALVFMNGTRAFAAVTNYVSMDGDSRNALDHMTQEIRQAGNLVEFSPTHLKFGWHAQTNSFLVFDWDANSGKLIEWNTAGTMPTNTLLAGCDQLTFSLYNSLFAPTTNISTGKGISVSWKCSRMILGSKSTTENMQQALIVIRNKPL